MGRVQSRIVLTLLAFGGIFILFQIYVFKATWLTFDQAEEGKSKKKRKYDDWTPPPDYFAVERFSDLAAELSVPVFLIEPAVLESVWAHRTGRQTAKGRCKFLCRGANITTFGVISDSWITQNFLDALGRNDFKSCATQDGDPRKLSVNELVPPRLDQHILLTLNQQLIHIVIFHQRSGSYLWHGPIPMDFYEQCHTELLQFPMHKLPFGGEGAGSYHKMEFADIRIDGIQLTVPKYPIKFLRQMPNAKHLECNFQQARDFLTEYGREETDEDADFRSRAREILERATRALDGIGAPFWISSGTCLGWFRECNIIAHSVDVDLGMRIRDYNSRVIPAMEAQGLQLLHLFGKEEDSFELSFARDSIKLDIFFFYEEDDYIWNGGTDANTGEKFQYVFHPFELCWTELVGLRVRVPCPTLPYIEANYGGEWNQKVTQWDWKDSPPNVRPNGRWPEREWPMVIQTFPIM